ncbi:MAG: DUF3102 domain-containing protein [Burkholderiales bacterium]
MMAQGAIRDIAALAVEINREHAEACRYATAALQHAKRAGELLRQVKTDLPHGQWLPWVRTHCAFSTRTAQGYMRIAEHWPTLQGNAQRVADLPLRHALAALARSTLPANEPTDWAVEAAVMEREDRRRQALIRMARRTVEDPDATPDELLEVKRQMSVLVVDASTDRLVAERRIGQLLKEADAAGWGTVARELLARPEHFPAFLAACDARIAEQHHAVRTKVLVGTEIDG